MAEKSSTAREANMFAIAVGRLAAKKICHRTLSESIERIHRVSDIP